MKHITLTAAALLAAMSLTADDNAGKTETANKKDCTTPKNCCCCCCCHALKGKKVKICPMPGTAANQQNTPGVVQITEGEMVIYAIPVDGTQNAQTAQSTAPAPSTPAAAPAN